MMMMDKKFLKDFAENAIAIGIIGFVIFVVGFAITFTISAYVSIIFGIDLNGAFWYTGSAYCIIGCVAFIYTVFERGRNNEVA